MGLTIAYRGRLADLARVEDFEDRLLDFALEVSGLAQIWRSHADDPRRIVRGVILNLAPGHEPVSLLLSPEGWLIGLTDIEDAERGRLTEPPWCFAKTRFGPLEAHVAVVEMFAALRDEFLADLEVSDEGGYWETRDLAELARRRSLVQGAIDGLAGGLRHGLSREAAEDPEILLRHVERVAAQVQRVLRRPAEHPPVTFPDEDAAGGGPGPEAVEALWDETFKHNRRQQERLQRALEERRSRGEDEETALGNALDDLGSDVPGEEPGPEGEPWPDDGPEPFAGPDEPGGGDGDEGADAFGAEDDERHPLLRDAMDLLKQLHTAFRDADARSAPSLHTLFQGAGDAMGGLAQALPGHGDDADEYGLRLTQLERALRGAEFARGALYPLRPAVTAEQFDELHRRLKRLEQDVFQEIVRLRSEHRADEW